MQLLKEMSKDQEGAEWGFRKSAFSRHSLSRGKPWHRGGAIASVFVSIVEDPIVLLCPFKQEGERVDGHKVLSGVSRIFRIGKQTNTRNAQGCCWGTSALLEMTVH